MIWRGTGRRDIGCFDHGLAVPEFRGDFDRAFDGPVQITPHRNRAIVLERPHRLREDILDEKVLSAIVEIKVSLERVEEIIRLVWEVEKQIETVVAIGVGVRCDQEGEENVVAPILEKLGYTLERAKTNIGLGRITNPAAKPEPARETAGAR